MGRGKRDKGRGMKEEEGRKERKEGRIRRKRKEDENRQIVKGKSGGNYLTALSIQSSLCCTAECQDRTSSALFEWA